MAALYEVPLAVCGEAEEISQQSVNNICYITPTYWLLMALLLLLLLLLPLPLTPLLSVSHTGPGCAAAQVQVRQPQQLGGAAADGSPAQIRQPVSTVAASPKRIH